MCTHAWKYGMDACICVTVCMHAVTCESDSICGPDFIRLDCSEGLSVLQFLLSDGVSIILHRSWLSVTFISPSS